MNHGSRKDILYELLFRNILPGDFLPTRDPPPSASVAVSAMARAIFESATQRKGRGPAGKESSRLTLLPSAIAP